MQSLPPDEPSVDFVPVLHTRLAEFPAVEDIASIDLPAEIDQSRVHPFADDTEVAQLGDIAFDIPRESLRFDLKKVSDRVGVLRTRSNCRELELADFVLPSSMIADEILDNSFDERKGAARFLDGEESFHDSYSMERGVGVQALGIAESWCKALRLPPLVAKSAVEREAQCAVCELLYWRLTACRFL